MGENGGIELLRQAISKSARKKADEQAEADAAEVLTDEQAEADAAPKPAAEDAYSFAEFVCEVAGHIVQAAGVLNESLDELTELLIANGTTLTASEVQNKLSAWSMLDVLKIREAVWDAIDWDGVKKAEASFFGKAATPLGIGNLVPNVFASTSGPK